MLKAFSLTVLLSPLRQNCSSLHTEQGPIRSNLLSPNYCRRFIFVEGEAEGLFFFLRHALHSGGGKWVAKRTADTQDCNRKTTWSHVQDQDTYAHTQNAPHGCISMLLSTRHTVKRGIELRPKSGWGGGGLKGRQGGRSGRSDSAVTGLNYRESGEHREEFPKERCHPNRLIPTFTGLSSRPSACLPIKILAKGREGVATMQAEMEGTVQKEEHARRERWGMAGGK